MSSTSSMGLAALLVCAVAASLPYAQGTVLRGTNALTPEARSLAATGDIQDLGEPRLLQDLPFRVDKSPTAHPYNSMCQDGFKSGWCTFNAVSGDPGNDDHKYGRCTIYGDADGSGQGWCGKRLKQVKGAVPVALGTKYLAKDGEISPNSGYCGECMCIRIRGVDTSANPWPPKGFDEYKDNSFKGVVLDSCPECEDDHIDVNAAKPFFGGAVDKEMAYTAGIMTAEWQFVDCDTNCEKYFD